MKTFLFQFPQENSLQKSDKKVLCEETTNFCSWKWRWTKEIFSTRVNLVRDLVLSKDKAEFLASYLKEKFLLKDDVCIPHFRKRNKNLTSYFSVEGSSCFCNNIDELFHGLYQEHVPSEWCLLIDSFKRIFKAVLLCNGYKKPSIPIRHSVHMKKCYANMQILLNTIKYSEYN